VTFTYSLVQPNTDWSCFILFTASLFIDTVPTAEVIQRQMKHDRMIMIGE